MTQWFDRRSARTRRAALLLPLLLLSAPAPGVAQVPVESGGGTRALGMGGAFTAVADDASATWWNPAAMSTLLADAVLEGGSGAVGDGGASAFEGAGAWRVSPFAVAVAFPAVGISFNHLTGQDIRSASTASGEPGREDQTAAPVARALDLSSIGVTLAQSLGDYLVVGGTLRLLHGATAAAPVRTTASVDEALDAVGALDKAGRTVADADVGALAFAGPVRLALVARNLGGHRFGDGPAEFRLERNVRVGAAFGPGAPWARRAWTMALDADLTTTHAPDGDRRSLATGGERWFGSARRFAVRAGGQVQTTGDARPSVSAGGSFAVKTGVLVEAQLSGGGDRALGSWGVGGRVTF